MNNLKDRNAVYYKNENFFIAEFNFYTFSKIIKRTNPLFYENLKNEDFEIMRLAIDSIIMENKELSTNEIMDYIESLSIENIKSIGIDYYEMLYRSLNSHDFNKDDFKGIIFIDNELDYQFIFNFIDDLEVLFVFNNNTNKLEIIDRDLNRINTSHIKDIDDIYDKFSKFHKKHLKNEKNKFLNGLIKKFLESFFDLEVFFEEFKTDFLERLFSLILITDLSEEVEEILLNNIDDFDSNKKLINLLNKKLNKNKENDKKLSKYGIKLG